MYAEDDFRKLRESIDWNILESAEMLTQMGGQPGAREMALVRTKLQEAKMWVGKVLEANGNPLPEEFRDEAKK